MNINMEIVFWMIAGAGMLSLGIIIAKLIVEFAHLRAVAAKLRQEKLQKLKGVIEKNGADIPRNHCHVWYTPDGKSGA